ncbi:hypothetical protein [Virgibacillus sp. 6R]|uniref:hypothetical protein n=1 Tax=Metabacillus sp. 22489 TaxID=3453928 RepID=UPI0011A1773D
MKKISILFLVALFSLSFFSTNAQAKLTLEEETYIKTITEDFVKTHNINLNDYRLFDIREVLSKKENLKPKDKSLLSISRGIVQKQHFIDCSPLFYLNKTKTKGYILEKGLNGMNSLYILSYDKPKENWIIVKKTSKMGSDLVDLGLIKGNK